MTEVTRLLLGLVVISGAPVGLYLFGTMYRQIKADGFSWRNSAPICLAASMAMFLLTLAFFAAAALISKTSEPKGLGTHLIWGAWTSAWVGAMLGLLGLRRGSVRLALCFNVMWAIGVLTWKGFFT